MNGRMNPSGLCMCGCGEVAPISAVNDRHYGYVKGESKKYVAGHSGRTSVPEYIERDCGHDTPCWIWQRSQSHGYGKVRRYPKTLYAHRVIYERERGPIPEGLDLDHLCRVTLCVNPDHLEPVTRSENVRRGYEAARRAAA